MSVRHDILRFLRDPLRFSSEVQPSDVDVWNSGLNDYVTPWLESDGQKELRQSQGDAWSGAASNRVALVLGPPGTGKSFLLATFAVGYIAARQSANLPCRVLTCGFTRESIGNLLEKSAELASRFLPTASLAYFGTPPNQTLPSSVDVVSLDGKRHQAEARTWLNETQHCIVGATTWSLNKLFEGGDGEGPTDRVFDLILIDEASQMLVGQGLLALCGIAEHGRVIVAGDDRQLPPIRSMSEVEFDGRALGGSLYGFLKSAGIAEFGLEETFRLNAPLTAFPAQNIYGDSYRSAVPNRRLSLRTNWEEELAAWEQVVLDPENPVIVLLHDGSLAGTENPFERGLIAHLVRLLIDRLSPCDGSSELDAETLWREQLAVVTPHRAQNAALREDLASVPLCNAAIVETVDRIQGRERDVVLAAYTVADPEFALAEAAFLFGRERLNVTVTRPRSKLVLLASRRLLGVLPNEEDVFESVDRFREYLYDAQYWGEFKWPHGADQYSVEVRVNGFATDQQATLDKNIDVVAVEPAVMTQQLEELLGTIRAIISEGQYHTAAEFDVDARLGRTVSLEEYRQLLELGWIRGDSRPGPRGTFRVWSALDDPRPAFSCTSDSVRVHLGEVIDLLRRDYRDAIFNRVRAEFLWLGADGRDIFRPIVETLAAENFCRLTLRTNEWGGQFETIGMVDPHADTPDEPPLIEEELPEDDFVVLNALEDIEARLIDSGVYETFVRISDLVARLGRDRASIENSLNRLAACHWLLWLGDGVVRSRIAELTREVRYVKQRFGADDVDRRPFLVRSLRLKLVDRRKPQHDQPTRSLFDRLSTELADAGDVATILDGLDGALRECWISADNELRFAGFQLRGFEGILRSYLGQSDPRAFVVAADTGSGKTEAAFLPLIVGAAIDRLAGRRGVKVVAVYPRIRLVYNQAQRIVRYLATLANQPGCPLVTLGIQSGDVPRNFRPQVLQYHDLWDESPLGGFQFPFFGCPESDCDGELILLPGQSADQLDQLRCTSCSWHFDGFVGSKDAICRHAPDFLLPVTESLHQWLQEPDYGMLWGDRPEFAPPRALLADEIHLYSHIQGAQVGYTFQRLLSRVQLNSRERAADTPPPLAIGMSATLGDPARVWGTLVGRDESSVLPIAPEAHEQTLSVRGREYFLFIQPEIESRGQFVAGASTTIQAIMCIAHGMRRRTGRAGGYRGLAFYDSIDRVKEQLSDFRDAEVHKVLSRYRTTVFPRNSPTDACCRQPETCEAFRNGECWYFAARKASGDNSVSNDPYQVAIGREERVPARYCPGRPLTVMRRPVYSGTQGFIDRQVRESDLVFSTSSLEVGFDDPEMTFIFQQYAPQNLASFIQRKGRGGRGIDDRPIAGITLSIYSPRDTWYFRHPDQMLDPGSYETPLNMDNYFVRRGQAVSALLDAIARRRGRRSAPGVGMIPVAEQPRQRILEEISQEVDADANALLTILFGNDVYRDLVVHDAAHLWQLACRELRLTGEALPLRELLNWVPGRLFDAINLPLLEVTYKDDQGRLHSRQEDVSMAFQVGTPCNATRRYGRTEVHWRPLVEPRGPGDGPLFGPPAYTDAANFIPLIDDGRRQQLGDTNRVDEEIRSLLPDDVAVRLQATGRLTDHRLHRPVQLPLGMLGELRDSRSWQPRMYWDPATEQLVRHDGDAPTGLIPVHHKTRSRMLHFPILQVDEPLGAPMQVAGLERLTSEIVVFRGGRHNRVPTGLRVLHAFWGVEIRLRLDQRDGEDPVWTRVFTSHNGERNMLHGYTLDTEGIRLSVDSAQLDEFVDRTMTELNSDNARRRWVNGQFLRYELASRLAAAAVPAYVAGSIADLLVAAGGHPELRPRVDQLLQDFRIDDLRDLLHDSLEKCLSRQPTLTADRIDDYVSRLSGLEGFRALFDQCIKRLRSDKAIRAFIRSQVLHGLLLALKNLFVIYGRGDERQVLVHARLPIQFGNRADDVLSVFEAGDHGDGTTRTFQEQVQRALHHWRLGELGDCPNAAEDAMVDRLFEQMPRHETWRQLDPRDPHTLPRIMRELTGFDVVDASLHQVIARVLFQTETLGAEAFAYYDLVTEIRAVRTDLDAQLRRRASTWELVSAVVARVANKDPQLPHLCRLLEVYRSFTNVVSEESLSPESRLADQVQRLCGSLCIDGCPACVHQESSLMPDHLQALSVSRQLLARYQTFLLEPRTIDVRIQDLPNIRTIRQVAGSHGSCRLVVSPGNLAELSETIEIDPTEIVFDPFENTLVVEFRG